MAMMRAGYLILLLVLVAVGGTLSHGVHHNAETLNAFGTVVHEVDNVGQSLFLGEWDWVEGEEGGEKVDERLRRWLVKETAAQAANIHAVDEVHIPLVVNLIFCGFQGDGDGVRLTEEQMGPWFEHIDHIVPHLVMPVGEHQTTSLRSSSRESNVRYRIHLNAVQFSPMFQTLLEDAQLWNTRAEDFDESEHGSAQSVHYINSDRIMVMLNSIIGHLGLDDSYNIFIMNPNRPVDRDAVYGYRRGFSDSEIQKVFEAGPMSVPDMEAKECPVREEAQLPPQLRPKNATRYQVVDMVEATEKWSRWYISMVFKSKFPTMYVGGIDNGVDEDLGAEDASAYLFYRPAQDPDIVTVAQTMAANGTRSEKEYLSNIEAFGPFMHEECLVDGWIGHGRVAFLDLQAGPFEWGPAIEGEGSKTGSSVPKPPRWNQTLPFSEQHVLHDTVSESTDSKLDGILQFVAKHCQGASANTPKCLSLMAQRTSLAVDRIKSGHDLMGNSLEGAGADVETDRFLSELGAVISAGIRTMIVPPVPTFRIKYSKRIVYHVFVIANQKDYDPLGEGAFAYEEFQHELMAMKSPSQEVVFELKRLHMVDSPVISSAFHSSIRTAVLPSLSTEGAFASYEHVFLDTRVLRDRLISFESEIVRARLDSDRFVLEEKHVPVFLFSVSMPAPLYVDKYYQAKALKDMIVVTQSPFMSVQSRFHCNGKPIYNNMRNPVKAALAAAALQVGGLAHQHIAFHKARKAATQNWVWALGDSPLVHTSRGTHFNQFQTDAMMRNVIANGVDESIDTVNEVFRLLQDIETTKQNINIQEHPLMAGALESQYGRIKDTWASIGALCADMRLDDAETLLVTLQEQVDEYRVQGHELAAKLTEVRCMTEASIHEQVEEHGIGMLMLFPILFCSFDVVVVLLVLLCRPSKPKVKTN